MNVRLIERFTDDQAQAEEARRYVRSLTSYLAMRRLMQQVKRAAESEESSREEPPPG